MQVSSNLEKARFALEGGHDIPIGALTTAVLESWKRCRDGGLHPDAEPQGAVLSLAEVERKREELRACRRLALAEMQVLYSQIAGSNFLIAFADRNGMVIDTISDTHFAKSQAGKSIIPGSFWSESERGTNALGLSLISADAASVYGREHYFTRDAHLSCVAAPIFNVSGTMIGAIDASSVDATRQQHTQALVKMAATQIGNALFFQEQLGFYIFAFHPRAEFLGTLSTGLIAVSGEGEIISINRYGEVLLGDLAVLGVRDLHFDEVFDCPFGTAMSKLLGGEMMQIRDHVGSGVFMTCRQIARGAARIPGAGVLPKQQVVTSKTSVQDGFVCQDLDLRQALKDLDRAATLRLPVHIFGETGTGKELVARMVHHASGRSGEFVAVNCGAIPETLFISELFGHEKGAYTNANQQGSRGLIRFAHQGTLFLDEVADIPLAAQAALLRFLDDMKVRPLGGLETYQVDLQIVSATNQDLMDAVANKRFRADLLFRLNAFAISLPPLRERQDFAAIVRHLIAGFAPAAVITDTAIEKLHKRSWPGNIRQLRSFLQMLLARHSDGVVDEDALEDEAVQPTSALQACPHCASGTLRRNRCLKIRSTFIAAERNVAQTARILGLSRTTVYKHIKGAGAV